MSGAHDPSTWGEVTTGQRLFLEWLDQIDDALKVGSKGGALYRHPSMTGNAREHLVRNLLTQFLPPILHIGQGQIISNRGGRSKQIDVVIYDSRFPVLSDGSGSSLYLIEGCIAAIEIKSRLDRSSLFSALDNCYSVKQLGVGINTESFLKRFFEVREDFDSEDKFIKHVMQRLSVRTYVYSFSGLESSDALHAAVSHWFRADRGLPTGVFAMPPSIVASGGAVTANCHDKFGIAFDDDHPVVNDDGNPAVVGKPICMTFRCRQQFSLLACHILDAIQDRYRAELQDALFPGFSQYIPFEAFFDRHPITPESPMSILAAPAAPGAHDPCH